MGRIRNIYQELGRKGFHLSSLILLFAFLYLNHYVSRQFAMFILVLVFTLVLIFEFLRLDIKVKPPLLHRIWKEFKRKKEAHFIGGEVFQIAGIIITLAAFDIRVATAAILMVIFGDPAAALVGKSWGKRKLYKKKTWEGTGAEFITNTIIGLLCIQATFEAGRWYLLTPALSQAMWIPIIGMAIAATLTELFVDKIDDNLAVPIVAGVIGQTLLYLI